MSLPFVLACLWLAAANVIGMLPSRRKHWPQAYVLIGIGVPILVWLFIADGLLWAAIFAIAAASILRWPLRYAARWLAGVARTS